MSGEKRTLGAAIFADIEDNEYLNKIHEKVLYNYALRLLQLTKKEPLPFDQKEKRDALRFADLLSKSNDPEKANAHKIWAQEIVILLNELSSLFLHPNCAKQLSHLRRSGFRSLRV